MPRWNQRKRKGYRTRNAGPVGTKQAKIDEKHEDEELLPGALVALVGDMIPSKRSPGSLSGVRLEKIATLEDAPKWMKRRGHGIDFPKDLMGVFIGYERVTIDAKFRRKGQGLPGSQSMLLHLFFFEGEKYFVDPSSVKKLS